MEDGGTGFEVAICFVAVEVGDKKSFILWSVLRRVHTHFQSQLSTECDLVLPFFNVHYRLVSFRLSSNCLRLLPHLPVTSILPCYLYNLF